VPGDIEVASMPDALWRVLFTLVANKVIDETEVMDSCTINVYCKGQWIPPHIDNPTFARPFVTVSLLSSQIMTLGRGMARPTGETKPDPETVYDGEEFRVELPAQSAVRMESKAADEYEHAIPPVTQDRISLTFRRRMAIDAERDAIESLTAVTEKFRAMYREKRLEGREDEVRPVKEVSEEQRRRETIARERAQIKAARDARKRAKKEGKEQVAMEAEERGKDLSTEELHSGQEGGGTGGGYLKVLSVLMVVGVFVLPRVYRGWYQGGSSRGPRWKISKTF